MLTAAAVLGALLALVAVTTVHEAGHFLAVRAKRGRVIQVRVGLGPTAWRGELAGTDVRVALIPLGGRIRYDSVPPGTGQAVIAISGAAANLLTALLAFLLAFWTVGPDLGPLVPPDAGPVGFATASTGAWFWAVPGAVLELVLSGSAQALNHAVRGLAGLLATTPVRALPYAVGALSALWAALNLVPIPGIETDGWHMLRSLLAR